MNKTLNIPIQTHLHDVITAGLNADPRSAKKRPPLYGVPKLIKLLPHSLRSSTRPHRRLHDSEASVQITRA